jgi:hypothetical protein
MDGLQAGEREAFDVAEFPGRRLIGSGGEDGRTNAKYRSDCQDYTDTA